MAPSAMSNGDQSFIYPRVDDLPTSDDIYLNNPDPENDVDIPDELLGSRKKMRVIVLGSGVGGINFFKFAEDKASNIEIRCYEKNEDIGGTWLENRYPGCACDVGGLPTCLCIADPQVDSLGRIPISLASSALVKVLLLFSRDMEVYQDGS